VDRVRQAVRDLVELQPDMIVVGEAADGATAAALIPQCAPDIVLLDGRMESGVDTPALDTVHHSAPQVMIVIYAANPQPGERLAALAAGAAAFVEKDVLPHDLLHILRQVAEGPPEPNGP
jgi:DNA-binding NarL/FixJ family response regulator